MHDDDLDPEGPSAEDLERFGDEFVTCPSCGKAVYDQAELCHLCGHAMERRPGGRVPLWAVVTTVVLGVVLIWLWVF